MKFVSGQRRFGNKLSSLASFVYGESDIDSPQQEDLPSQRAEASSLELVLLCMRLFLMQYYPYF